MEKSSEVSNIVRLTLIALLIGLFVVMEDLNTWFEVLVKNVLENDSLLVWCAIWLFYIVLISCPFVPGVELGIVLMAVGDPLLILLVYLMTVIAFSVVYGIGAFCRKRLGTTVKLFCPIDKSIESDLVSRKSLLFKSANSPYLLIGLLLNMPGNFLLGGGGISMMCDYSRKVCWSGFVITTVVAVTPLPFICALMKVV